MGKSSMKNLLLAAAASFEIYFIVGALSESRRGEERTVGNDGLDPRSTKRLYGFT